MAALPFRKWYCYLSEDMTRFTKVGGKEKKVRAALIQLCESVAVVNGEEHHALRCVPFPSNSPNVMLHLSVFNASHVLGGGGVIWRKMSSTWMSRVVMNHFFYNCCGAMGRNFSTVNTPAIFGMHLIRPLFQASQKVSIFLCMLQDFQNTYSEQFMKFLVHVQGEIINAWGGSWDLPLECLLNQFQEQWLEKCWGQPFQRCWDREGLHVSGTLSRGAAPFLGDATPMVAQGFGYSYWVGNKRPMCNSDPRHLFGFL